MNITFNIFKSIATRAAMPLLLALVTLPALAASSRYQPNAAGDEIADSQTGLTWRRCAEGQGWNGSTCSGNASVFAWDGALAHAQGQANSSGVAWRLPNAKELSSLVDLSRLNPTVDTAVFPGTPNEYFWSATPYAGDAVFAWFVDFYFGHLDYQSRGNFSAARLVRNGQ